MPKTFIRGEFRGQTNMDEALKAGDETEARFIELLESRGYKAYEPEDLDHSPYFIDVIGVKGGREVTFQVKGRNRPGRHKDFDDNFVTLELTNVVGEKGWVHGEARYLVKEVKKGFAVYRMITLRDFVKSRVGEEVATSLIDTYEGNGGLYKKYTRPGRKDEIVYASSSDIEKYFTAQGERIYFYPWVEPLD
jgi:hypothetical protein